jgi:aerobic carbon-monoxide dehydrogenase medium subunit
VQPIYYNSNVPASRLTRLTARVVGRLGRQLQEPYLSGMFERTLRHESAVTVKCLTCRNVGVLAGASLSRLAIPTVQADCGFREASANASNAALPVRSVAGRGRSPSGRWQCRPGWPIRSRTIEAFRLSQQTETRLYIAPTLDDAIAALTERGRDGAALAGGTWIMRAPLRGERHDFSYVAIAKIAALQELSIGDREVSIGACVTHAELACELAAVPDCRALALAAGNAANPAIRQVATVGGNLCATNFAAADLVPALLCLDAAIELQRPCGAERIPLEDFLKIRSNLPPGQLVRRIIISRAQRRSVHARLPLRKAGDYPVAIFSLGVTLDARGVVTSARAALGSIEPTARRWHEWEAELIGRPLEPAHAAEMAAKHCGILRARDGIEAPAWYRLKVLPSLVRKAVAALREQRQTRATEPGRIECRYG